MKDIRNLDLNLLKILQAVVITRNTHKAAEQLEISQASVSRGMAKLKDTFGDQLFIRKAHGVEPSELAEKLAEAAEEMISPIIKVVESYQSFDPQTYSGEITISLNIFLLELYGDDLFTELRKAFPCANFKLIYWQQQSLPDMLNGHIDYMVQLAGVPFPQDISIHTLTEVKLNLIARKDHPVLSESSDWEAIHHLPVTRIAIDGFTHKRSPVEELFLSKGYQANVALTTHSLKVLLNKLEHSDALALGSSYMTTDRPSLRCYPLPPLRKDLRKIHIHGGYLRSRRDFPLSQLLHQLMQTFFDNLERP